MKLEYSISCFKDYAPDVPQACLCIAESEEQARAYYAATHPHARVVGVCLNNCGHKPGMPVLTVPDDWQTPAKSFAEE